MAAVKPAKVQVTGMRFLLKVVLGLALAGVLGLLIYAVFFDLPSPLRDITIPVESR